MSKLNKERFVSGNDMGLGRVEVGLEFHKIIDYDRKAMRKALSSGGAIVTKEARRLVSRNAISLPGENPGLVTGKLRRSIGVIARGSKGGWIKVGPRSFKSLGGGFFYPAILFYGSKKRNIDKRNNFMVEALQTKRAYVRGEIRAALKDSLVPR